MKFSIQYLFISFILFLTTEKSLAQEKIAFQEPMQIGNVIYNEEHLNGFYEKLRKIKNSNKKVSVLQLGDSHMQMGYFADEMRTYFSNQFQLSSIGNIFPYPIAGYKPFYIQSRILSGSWEGKNYLKSEDDYKYGVTGFTVKTSEKKAGLEIIPQRYPSEIGSGNQLVIYYTGDDSSSIDIIALNSFTDSNTVVKYTRSLSTNEDNLKRGWKKMILNFEKPVNRIKLFVNQQKNLSPFYINGLQLYNTERKGVIYNNCGVGGAQFSSLCNNSSYSISQIKDLNPDLIIFSYGSNESYTPAFKYINYLNMVNNYITAIKKELPDVSIILTSPPDTRSKDRYPRNSDSIGIAFKQIATEKKISYWDLRKQMGGDGSLHRWLRLGLASKDKLHFTKEGYSLQAKLLLEAIFTSYNLYVTESEKVSLPVINVNFK